MAPFMLIGEGFFRAWWHRSQPPKGRSVVMNSLRMTMFSLAKQTGPKIVSKPIVSRIPNDLSFVKDIAKVQTDMLKLVGKA